jgi:hypothetical protein
MSPSGDVGNGARGRGIVRHRVGCGGGGLGHGGLSGGVWEDSLPRCPGYFHREITLQMGDPGKSIILVTYIDFSLLSI